jgi:hypothetical protein
VTGVQTCALPIFDQAISAIRDRVKSGAIKRAAATPWLNGMKAKTKG